MNEWTNERTNEWMNSLMNEWIRKWMNLWYLLLKRKEKVNAYFKMVKKQTKMLFNFKTKNND